MEKIAEVLELKLIKKKVRCQMQLSKSKVGSGLLYCVYLVCFLADSDMSYVDPWLFMIHGLLGFVMIWVGQGLGPVRSRRDWIPVWLELSGWTVMLLPVIDGRLWESLR